VTNERKALPTEDLGRRHHIRRPVDEVVDHAGVKVLRAAVAGQVERHKVEVRQQRSETVETGGVVEPPMEGQHRRAVRRAPLAGCEAQVGQIEYQVTRRHRWSR
jgi:hypothetical protein